MQGQVTWQKQLTQQLQPIADLRRHLQQVSLPSQAVIAQFTEAARSWRPSFEHLIPSPEQLKLFEQIAEIDRHKRALDRIGLVPHPSMPFLLLDDENDEQLRATLQKHYGENWSEISAKIRKRVQALDLDDEAKAVMAEALEAHGSGYYRSVCRLLLSEIERVARVELEGNRAGALHVHTVIGKPAESLPLSSTNLSPYLALELYERLTDHLYIRVDDTNRAQMEQHPVPNRHAAIHGLIVYRSFWNSLNVIFMTDYAFQLVSAIKEAQREAGV